MGGLLAWAADVVSGSGHEDDEEIRRIPLVLLTAEQQQYAVELDERSASLRRLIEDLRLRIPPPHISQRLPHLHAHSIASNAALTLQLNAHSTTRQQAKLREATLQEENAAYEKAISNCQKKIAEKQHEADLLGCKLKELDYIEKEKMTELENKVTATELSQSRLSPDDYENTGNFESKGEPSRSVKLEELEEKKREQKSVEEMIKSLEREWLLVEHDSMKQPTPAQRERLLEQQLHSLIEQLMAKQAQAEGLVKEMHMKERELEGLNASQRRIHNDVGNTRSRWGRGIAGSSEDYRRAWHSGGRAEGQLKSLMLWPAFVLYILALHVIVFIKISF